MIPTTISSSKTKQTPLRTCGDNFIGTRHSTLSPNKNTTRTIASSTQQRWHSPKKWQQTYGRLPFSSLTAIQTNSTRPAQERATQQLHQRGYGQLPQHIQRCLQLSEPANQHKSYGHITITDSPHGTSFTQKGSNDSTTINDSGRDDDTIREAPKRFADWTCSVCGQTGHPSNPKWCPLVKALSNDKTVQNKLKAAVDTDRNSDSASSDNKSCKQKSKSTKKKGKPYPKTSEQRCKEDKELIQQVLATVGCQEYSSDSSSNRTAESNTEYDSHFQMCDTGFQMHQTEILDKLDEDGSVSSVETYRSAQKYRSALRQQAWTLVSKKPKRRKHKSTTQIHRGDTIVMKNNLTGTEQIFTSDKRISNYFSHTFSALNDDLNISAQLLSALTEGVCWELLNMQRTHGRVCSGEWQTTKNRRNTYDQSE